MATTQYEDVQKFSKEQIESSLKSFSSFSKGLQTIAAEIVDYTKRSFEEGTNALEKLGSAKSLDKALEIQTEYARTSYENFIAETTRISALYTDLTRDVFKPYENALARAQQAPGK